MSSLPSVLYIRLFSLVILLLGCHLSLAGDVIKVAASDFPPYTIVGDESITGIDIILANQLAEKMNMKIKYVQCPWKRCLKLMEHGQIDLLTGVYKRPDREKYMLFMSPHYTEATDTFYIAINNPLQIKHYDDLKNISIGLELSLIHI